MMKTSLKEFLMMVNTSLIFLKIVMTIWRNASEDIFEKVVDEDEDIFEKVVKYGEDIFEKYFDDTNYIFEEEFF